MSLPLTVIIIPYVVNILLKLISLTSDEKVMSVTRPSFCTTASERVYITASGCEIEFGGTRGL